MAVTFADLSFIPVIAPQPSFPSRRPSKRFGIRTEEQLKQFADTYNLKPAEIELIRLIEIKDYGLAEIGHYLGCSRQNVNQKYSNLEKKIHKRKSKLN